MITIGIDPGTTTVGYAVIKKNSQNSEILDYGVIQTPPKISLGDKLLEIGQDIGKLIDTYKPERIGIEKLFFNTNITTGIDVSHARGVILYECRKRGFTCYEFTPLQVKKAISGNGKAHKMQLQNATAMLFGLSEIPKPDDAADALAIAYITALQRKENITGDTF